MRVVLPPESLFRAITLVRYAGWPSSVRKKVEKALLSSARMSFIVKSDYAGDV